MLFPTSLCCAGSLPQERISRPPLTNPFPPTLWHLSHIPCSLAPLPCSTQPPSLLAFSLPILSPTTAISAPISGSYASSQLGCGGSAPCPRGLQGLPKASKHRCSTTVPGPRAALWPPPSCGHLFGGGGQLFPLCSPPQPGGPAGTAVRVHARACACVWGGGGGWGPKGAVCAGRVPHSGDTQRSAGCRRHLSWRPSPSAHRPMCC